jgi:transmembrane sensor
MTVQDEFDDLLLDRYLAGECTLAERARVRDWAARGSENARLLERMAAARLAMREAEPGGEQGGGWDHDALRRRLQASMAATPAPGVAPGAPAPRPRRPAAVRPRGPLSRPLLRVAAALLVVAGGAAAVMRPWAGGRAERVAEAVRVIRAEPGRLVTVPLVDGTRVTLAAGSTLHVPASYGEQARDVVLEGQAYFDVVPDTARPFRVRSGRTTTQVLGTKFGVRAYPDDSAVAVVVREGRVSVRRAPADAGGGAPAGRDAVVLASGDRAQLVGSGTLQVARQVDVERELGWVQGRLAFDDVPLRDVLRELARWHATPVHVEDPALASTPVSAAFGSEPLREMVELLALSLDARVQLRDGALYITDRP